MRSEGCAEDAGMVTCNIGDRASHQGVTLFIVVTADVDGIAENVAVISSEFVDDPDMTNNTSTVDTEILPAFYYFLPIVQKH
jgi:hypothetical protein